MQKEKRIIHLIGGLICTIILLLAVSCGQTTREQTADEFISTYHDDQRHVTCWVFTAFNAGGISCIPDSELVQK